MKKNRHGSATTEIVSDCEVKTQRSFDAPMTLVFDAMTKPEHVRRHFSPDPEPLHICEIDLRVGGDYHYAWYAPNGYECVFRGTFLELEPPKRLVATWRFEGWPDDLPSRRPSGPRALKRSTQSRMICSPTPPIFAASVRVAPS